ncbi:MAG: hypothetical protein DDT36_01274 [Firmicutes bacterium]|nr:hypothetical protein [Bacillota bacterium]
MNNTVSLAEAANLILATPTVRYLLEGEPGIGKSSIMSILEKNLPGHHSAYIDMASLDLGDTGLPVPVHTDGLTAYYPNGRFKLHLNEPVILMLDEFGKASSRAVQNMLHPLLEARNPRFGDIPLHPESIVFLSSNLASDGVQDDIRAHTRNRVTSIVVTKPDAKQWIDWAGRNNIDPAVMAWVDRNPHCLASYLDDGQSTNPYIFNPRATHAKGAFVSPRSLSVYLQPARDPCQGSVRVATLVTAGIGDYFGPQPDWFSGSPAGGFGGDRRRTRCRRHGSLYQLSGPAAGLCGNYRQAG